jgi:NitT/TauT family transport system substrate-binding protein
MLDKAAWDQTIAISKTAKNLDGKTVLTKDPDASAQNMTYMQKALDALTKAKVDVKGDGFKPVTVTLTEGGA